MIFVGTTPPRADGSAGFRWTSNEPRGESYCNHLASTEAFPRAKAAALKALAIDSNSAEARCALAFAAFMYDGAIDTADGTTAPRAA